MAKTNLRKWGTQEEQEKEEKENNQRNALQKRIQVLDGKLKKEPTEILLAKILTAWKKARGNTTTHNHENNKNKEKNNKSNTNTTKSNTSQEITPGHNTKKTTSTFIRKIKIYRDTERRSKSAKNKLKHHYIIRNIQKNGSIRNYKVKQKTSKII